MAERRRFDAIVVDPPAFIKRKKDHPKGLAAYRRINLLAMQLLDRDGLLMSCSCSYHLAPGELVDAVQRAARHRDRFAQLIAVGGQSPDHPVHPAIDETRYLRAFLFRVTDGCSPTRTSTRSPSRSGRSRCTGTASCTCSASSPAGGSRAAAPRCRARPGSRSTWTTSIFFAAVGVIVGGRLGWMLFYGLDNLREDPLAIIRVWEGGMSFHGGLIGVMLAVAWFARRRGRSVADVFDFTAPLPAVGLCAGRIGNFINGELWGRPTELPWGMLVDGRVLHPSQLYEAALEGVVLFAVIWWFTRGPRPRLAPSGLFLDALCRFSAWPWSSCACRMPTSDTSRSDG